MDEDAWCDTNEQTNTKPSNKPQGFGWSNPRIILRVRVEKQTVHSTVLINQHSFFLVRVEK